MSIRLKHKIAKARSWPCIAIASLQLICELTGCIDRGLYSLSLFLHNNLVHSFPHSSFNLLLIIIRIALL